MAMAQCCAGRNHVGIDSSFAITTSVEFAELSSSEIAAYIATGAHSSWISRSIHLLDWRGHSRILEAEHPQCFYPHASRWQYHVKNMQSAQLNRPCEGEAGY